MEKKIKKAVFTCYDGLFADVYPIEIRSIDAWKNPEGGWDHNNSFVILREECKSILISSEITTRKLLQFLREMGVLSENSKGRVRIEDNWPYLEIQNKDTFEPLIQIYFEEDNSKELYI